MRSDAVQTPWRYAWQSTLILSCMQFLKNKDQVMPAEFFPQGFSVNTTIYIKVQDTESSGTMEWLCMFEKETTPFHITQQWLAKYFYYHVILTTFDIQSILIWIPWTIISGALLKGRPATGSHNEYLPLRPTLTRTTQYCYETLSKAAGGFIE